MSIKTRLALLVGTLLLAFLAVLFGVRQWERQSARERDLKSALNKQQELRQWRDLTNQPLLRFGHDFGSWSELTDFVKNPQADWAEQNLHTNLATYQIHALWILANDGHLIYTTQQQPGPALPPPAINPADLAPTTTDNVRHFYGEARPGLLEIWQYPIATPSTQPIGWLLVARLWDEAYLDALSQMTATSLQLSPPNYKPNESPLEHASFPLSRLDQQVVRWLRMSLPAPTTSLSEELWAGRTFIAFGLLTIIAIWLGLRRWVAQPLALIGHSLRTGEMTPLTQLYTQTNELGEIARLVETSFQQKNYLRQEIAHRARTEDALRLSQAQLQQAAELRAKLGRDLHDGVIQSLYAAGLGLESALTQLDSDPAGAHQRFLLCRQSLNETIREVRRFINGLEPEDGLSLDFSQALEALARTMQALWSVNITLDIDTATSARLNPVVQMHLLQINRECISNALRHGQAKLIKISLTTTGHHASLQIQDDGCGFVPAADPKTGHGLANIASRARELGGLARIAASPGHGTTITITFPLANPVR